MRSLSRVAVVAALAGSLAAPATAAVPEIVTITFNPMVVCVTDPCPQPAPVTICVQRPTPDFICTPK